MQCDGCNKPVDWNDELIQLSETKLYCMECVEQMGNSLSFMDNIKRDKFHFYYPFLDENTNNKLINKNSPMLNDHTRLDVIGDIHGRATALENLLLKMGYARRDGVWRHRERIAVFIGDYVDRGKENIRACRIVMDMQEAGAALAIMGNHDFNHIALATPDPENPGNYLRPRDEKNLGQTEETRKEFDRSPDDKRIILDWMKTLPLWLDRPGIRIVHAFWSPKDQKTLKPYLAADNTIIWKFFSELANGKEADPEAVDARSHLLSGPEDSLPDGISFPDSYGKPRGEVRLKWWEFDQLPLKLRDLALVSSEKLKKIPDKELSKSVLPVAQPDTDARPVIFGHYCMKPDDLFLGPRHVCVDTSVAKEGKLAAYRFSGESELNPDNLVFS